MKDCRSEELNAFFVKTFNKVLAYEDRSLSKACGGRLTVKEFHIIEAIAGLEPEGQNTMTRLAGELSVSVGALTTAVNTLVRKEYVVRLSHGNDRRIVLVSLTQKGKDAETKHRLFHKTMADSVASVLSDEQLDLLLLSLRRLSRFFDWIMSKGEKG